MSCEERWLGYCFGVERERAGSWRIILTLGIR